MASTPSHQRPPSRPPSPRNPSLQPTNTLAGPSSVPDHQQLGLPPNSMPIFPTPLPGYPILRPHFTGSDDLLAKFNLTAQYNRYVRPYSVPVDPNHPPPPDAADKGKGKEKELPPPNAASPAAETPGAGEDGEPEELHHGKTGKKWKNNYKHLIKGLPGKHITKKDDYLVTLMQVPPKQRLTIKPFDLRTQREAFSVSLEGITKWNVTQLVGDPPAVKEEKKRKKELRKLAKAGLLPPGVGTPLASGLPATPSSSTVPAGTPSAWPHQATAPARTATPRPAQSAGVQSSVPPPGHSHARSQEHVSSRRPSAASSYPAAQSPQGPATPAATPGSVAGAGAPAERRGLKREREESVPLAVEYGGAARGTTTRVLNARGGTGTVRPRPAKKQRMDMQGQSLEMPMQQPTPRA